MKYVLRNPVKAGITEFVEDYEFSSINGNSHVRLPIVDRIDRIGNQVPKEREARLKWLNVPTSEESDLLVQRGLRHSHFALPQERNLPLIRDLVSTRYEVTFEEEHPLPFLQK
jgi:hypothetical protein